jgi:hypothetical protein
MFDRRAYARKRHRDGKETERERNSRKFCLSRRGARNRGFVFSLTREEFDALVAQPCVYGGGHPKDGIRIGIDRKVNTKGYDKENCVPCCYFHNLVKSSWFTFEDMLHIVDVCPNVGKCVNKLSNGLRKLKALKEI